MQCQQPPVCVLQLNAAPGGQVHCHGNSPMCLYRFCYTLRSTEGNLGSVGGCSLSSYYRPSPNHKLRHDQVLLGRAQSEDGIYGVH